MGTGVIIAIDPGANGAVAVLNGDKVAVYDCPSDLPSRAWILKPFPSATVAIERVHAFTGQGVSSTFSFGENYGIWQGIAAANGCTVSLVTPQTWKKSFPELAALKIQPGETKAHFKGRAKNKAREIAATLFPQLADQLTRVKDADRAEALLIATHHKRILEGL